MRRNFKLLLIICLFFFRGMIIQAQVTNFRTLNGEIQSIQKTLVPDSRLAILDILINDTTQPIITVKGETNLPDGKIAIIKLLNSRGIHFVDSIRLLPEASLGDNVWGLATLSASNVRLQPDHASELVSQALMGTPLKVLDFEDGWYRIQTPDYYIGWMDGSGLALFTDVEMDRWKKSERYIFNKISGNAFDSPKHISSVVTDLILGDLFEVEGVVKGFLKIRVPDGRSGFVKKKDCLSWQDWTGRTPDVQSVISVARQLLGVPYMWGGTSCKTVDCSGLTKTSYYSQGIILARDASQQARYGEHPDFNTIGAIQPGDLLFFGRTVEQVTHVGLYMDSGSYIHASGLVRINSIDPKNPAYNVTERKNLVSASRILNSLNTEGIVLVKDHPWYSLP